MAKRLNRELQQLQEQEADWFTAGPSDESILNWSAMIIGPEETPYEGGTFQLSLEFAAEYPFKAPKVVFVTRVYHPNVRRDSGEICADVIGANWGPTLNVLYVLNTLRQMLREPETSSPLEPDIAREYNEDREAFNAHAREWTENYAS